MSKLPVVLGKGSVSFPGPVPNTITGAGASSATTEHYLYSI